MSNKVKIPNKTLTAAIEILIEEMNKKGANILGGELKHNGKRYKLYLEEVKDEQIN